MRKQILNKIGIFIVILFFFTIVSSQEVNVNYPEKVVVDEEFSFNLELLNFSEDIYDVKIDIMEDEKRISRILNNEEWKSTFYYLVDTIYSNETKTFSLKIFDYIGNGQITIKVRDSGGKVKTFFGYEIESIQSKVEEIKTELNFSEEKNLNVTGGKEESEKEIPSFKTTSFSSKEKEELRNISQKVIKLTPQTIKSENVKEELDKSIQSKYATYGFIFFCILLGILFMLKNRNYKNEFE